MFQVKSELEKRSHTAIPFSIDYQANAKTPYSNYFVPPLGQTDEVYFHEQRMSPGTLQRTLSRLFYSKEVERAVFSLMSDTGAELAYVLHYLRKLSPSLLAGIKKANVPLVVRLSDFAMVCPQAHCLRDMAPCTLCTGGRLLPSVRNRCVKNSLAASVLNLAATLFHRARGYFDLIDQFVTTNEFMYKVMLEAGWSKEKLSCIPTFTDTTLFHPSKKNSRSDYIFYSGRLDETKGVHVLVDAFAGLKTQRADGLRLKIAGQGPSLYVKKLKDRIRGYGLDDHIEFTGQVDAQSLSQLLSEAKLCVVPSLWYENLPNAMLESYACGTPVLASNLGSLPFCIKPGITGDLFEAGQAGDLAEKIAYYLGHGKQLASMSDNARKEALGRYAPGIHISALEALFRQLT